MSVDFIVQVDKKESYAILRTNGYINNIGGEKISEEVDKIINEGVKSFVLNLESSTIVNSIGISILIEIIEKLSEIGGKICFCHLTKTISKTFSIMGLTQFSEIYETESDAIRSIS